MPRELALTEAGLELGAEATAVVVVLEDGEITAVCAATGATDEKGEVSDEEGDEERDEGAGV